MAKARSVFFCQECGYESSKWMGQCPACHAWNTFVEEAPIKGSGSSQASGGGRRRGSAKEPVRLSGIKADEEVRTGTGIGELDRVLGGGTVAGSMVLVGCRGEEARNNLFYQAIILPFIMAGAVTVTFLLAQFL